MNSRLSRPVHPILFSLYPALALLAANADQMRPEDAFRSLLLAPVIGLLVWAVTGLVFRNLGKGAPLASAALLFLFSYGHVYFLLQDVALFGEAVGRHRYLVPLGLALLAGGFLWLRRLTSTRALNASLNAVGLIALAVPLLQFGAYQLRAQNTAGAAVARLEDPATGEHFELEAPSARPDVYYIVLDAYGRNDTLVSLIGYDNSGFLNELEDLGFYLAHCAQANYSQSELTLASTLNMAYLDDLGQAFVPNRDDRTPLRPLIKESLVRHKFAELGYEIVAFETGYPFSEWRTADRFLRPDLSKVEGSGLLSNLNGFENLLLRSSAGLLLVDFSHLLPESLVPDDQFEIRAARQRTLFALDRLDELPKADRPIFVFAHVVSPHRPFVFGPGGRARVKPNLFDYEDQEERMEWYRRGYVDQVEYLNQELLPVLRRLIEVSGPAPVILLQADHGPEEGSSRDRMGILSAFYLAGRSVDGLYPTITPVNNFRLIFNEFFRAELALLPDRSYYSTYNRPYDFRTIANEDCLDGERIEPDGD